MSYCSGRRIRALLLDVDGTLLDSRKRMPPAVRAAIRRAADAGLHVVLASGRMYGAIRQWVDDFGLRSPQICNNGAEVVDPTTGRRLKRLVLAPETVRRLRRFGREHDVTTVLYSGDRVLGEKHSPDDYLIERNGEFVEVIPASELDDPNLPVEKVLYLDRRRPDRLLELRNLLGRPDGFTATVSEPGILNFCHPEAAKHTALYTVCQALGVSPEECAAVGDGENDAEMLAAVGLGVAMGNATPRTRAAAQWIVADNDHDGAAEAIDRVLAAAER